MLNLECMIRNAYQSYPAYLNTLLSLTRRHVEMGKYGQKQVLIVLGISQYFFLWTR